MKISQNTLTAIFAVCIQTVLGWHMRLRCDQFIDMDYQDICGFSLAPNLIGETSQLKIASYVQSTEDSHNYIHAPNDCFILNFESFEDYFDPVTGEQYEPLSEDVSCNFTIGDISCTRINGTQLKLHANERFDILEGSIGPIMNPWSAKTLVISHVAQFESCEDGMDFDFDSAEDLTPGPYDLEISPNTMEGTSF